jgi:hypothetical protein
MIVTGYQFPDAPDPGKRFSWHMVEGEASCADERWRFRFPALTCDESPRIAMWLIALADWLEGSEGDAPANLSFTEPNLFLRAAGRVGDKAALEVDVDLEFKPPWAKTERAGSPYTLRLLQSPHELRRAAAAWLNEINTYPDGLESHT